MCAWITCLDRSVCAFTLRCYPIVTLYPLIGSFSLIQAGQIFLTWPSLTKVQIRLALLAFASVTYTCFLQVRLERMLSSMVVRVGDDVLSVEKLAQLSVFTVAPVIYVGCDTSGGSERRSGVGGETETNSD